MSTTEFATHGKSWLEMPDGKLHWLERECRIGRSREGNDIVVDDKQVSGRHVQLVSGPRGYSLVDQHSTNGTYLNGMLLRTAVDLKDGDEIRLAKAATFRFRCVREDRTEPAPISEDTTRKIGQADARECWLVLMDVAGYSGLIARLGSEGALAALQGWIEDLRPLTEQNGGTINSYVGDAIFAYWPCDLRSASQVCTALQALERYRDRAPVEFRTVVHHGMVLFTKSGLGEELTGQEVNFLFRSEKIAKKFSCRTMLSQAAARSLGLEEECRLAGVSTVDGIAGEFSFLALPDRFASVPPWKPTSILLVSAMGDPNEGFTGKIARARELDICSRVENPAGVDAAWTRHAPNLIVLDHPGGSVDVGESLRVLLLAAPRASVLVFSAGTDPAAAEAAVRAGAQGLIDAGDPLSAVKEAVRAVSEGGLYFNAAAAGAVLRIITNQVIPPAGLPLSVSVRELEVFRLVGLGQTVGDIAAALGVDEPTVDRLRKSVRTKLCFESDSGFAAAAARWVGMAAARAR